MDAAWVEQQLKPKEGLEKPIDRVGELRAYQNDAYAAQYSEFLAGIRTAALREVAAKYLYKLMAIKDEYEVARLLTKPEFEQRVRDMWESPEAVTYNLHPPLLRSFGVDRKLKLGSWFRVPLLVLKNLKSVRGTALDVFGYAAHRRRERGLIGWYRDLITDLDARVTPENLAEVLTIAALPDQIRGYEKIKDDSIARVTREAAERMEALKLAVVPQGTSA